MWTLLISFLILFFGYSYGIKVNPIDLTTQLRINQKPVFRDRFPPFLPFDLLNFIQFYINIHNSKAFSISSIFERALTENILKIIKGASS